MEEMDDLMLRSGPFAIAEALDTIAALHSDAGHSAL